LCRGLNPHDGSQLTDRARGSKNRTIIDITITAPKPVTMAWLVAGDKRIEWAFDDAKHLAMSLVEQATCVRDQSGPETENIFNTGIAWLDVPHRFTRPAKDDGKEDPFGHSHCLVFNLAPHFTKTKLKWKAVEFGALKRASINNDFHERLAENMRTLGYPAHWDGKEFTIDGISKEMQKPFCRRHDECVEKKEQVKTQRNKDKAAVLSRAAKNFGVKLADRVDYWVSKLSRYDFGKLMSVVEKAIFGYDKTASRRNSKRHVARCQSFSMMRDDTSTRGTSHEQRSAYGR